MMGEQQRGGKGAGWRALGAMIAADHILRMSIGVQKGPPIGVQKGPPSSSSVTGMTGALFVLVAA